MAMRKVRITNGYGESVSGINVPADEGMIVTIEWSEGLIFYAALGRKQVSMAAPREQRENFDQQLHEIIEGFIDEIEVEEEDGEQS